MPFCMEVGRVIGLAGTHGPIPTSGAKWGPSPTPIGFPRKNIVYRYFDQNLLVWPWVGTSDPHRSATPPEWRPRASWGSGPTLSPRLLREVDAGHLREDVALLGGARWLANTIAHDLSSLRRLYWVDSASAGDEAIQQISIPTVPLSATSRGLNFWAVPLF